MRNIQILLETIIRCGGNCSGCALSSNERTNKIDFDFIAFDNSVNKIRSYLIEMIKEKDVESVSIFLGQGDHFLLSDDDLKYLIKLCEKIVPLEIKHKTIILLTASAIGKNSEVERKMDIIYNESVIREIPMFIQTVFDPKKIIKNLKFKETYIKNILYLKNKCGMTDLTINLGNDIIEHMTPLDFHNWVLEYQFNHVEVNWVINKVTHEMWKNNLDSMTVWLKEWMMLYKQMPTYEINYIPISSRLLQFKNIPLMDVQSLIEDALRDNIYIDSLGNILSCQMGPINNLTPFKERLKDEHVVNINRLLNGKQIYNELQKVNKNLSKKAITSILKQQSCQSCEYKTVCAISGGNIWLGYKGKDNGCPWNIKEIYHLLETEFSDKTFKTTAFYKNPVQQKSLKKEGNETSDWFDKEVNKRIENEK